MTNGKFNDIAGYSTTQLEVVLDLGEKVNDITGLNIGFHYNFWGITSPAMVEYLISDDGKDFTSIKKLLFEDAKVSTPASDPISETAKISEFIYTPQVALSGRYIKVVIFVEGQAHVWGNELEVFNSKEVVVPEDPSTEPSKEPSTEPSTEPSKEPSKDPSKDPSTPAVSTDSSATSSKPVTPETSDYGFVAIALLAVITAGGVVVVRKFR
ncbi:MAG: hypothetical protein RR057_00240 [Clostridia bacterium]